MDELPNLSLSHFELNVKDTGRMEDFYTRVLGFVVTDRGVGPEGLVFLSRSSHEHHQIVLNPGGHSGTHHRIDHLSFRAATLSDLRRFHALLSAEPRTDLDTVSHGTTWSVYFRDPEKNRLELFADTPWHVDQPCRFPVDLSLDDDALSAFTESKLRGLPGFRPAAEWRVTHVSLLAASKPGC